MASSGPILAAGLLVGGIVGFFVGRFWAEHFRAEYDSSRIRASQRNYRGGTAAFVAGAVLLFGLFVLFGHTGA
jgi:L-asparagine transporter-like permease